MKTERVDTALMGSANMAKSGWFEHGTSRIYYEEQGSGEAVLLLPGFSESISPHLPLREALVAAGYRVIAADLPGSGRSLPQPRKYTPTYYEDDVHSFAVFLQQMGIGSAHLMGFSDGGEVALLMAALMPDIARSVVTWGAAGQISDPTGQMRAGLYNLIDNPIPPLKGYSDYLIASYGKDNARAMTQSLMTALSAIIDSGGDISLSKVVNITCSVLLIAGEHDIFVSSTLLDQLAARIRTVEVVVADGVGHDVHNARPEWFVQTIVDWLEKV